MKCLNLKESVYILLLAIHVANGCFSSPPPRPRPPRPRPRPPSPTPPPPPEAASGVCSGQISGALVPDPTDPTCKKFVQCLIGGPSAPMSCGPGTRFDTSCSCCNFESQVPCTGSPSTSAPPVSTPAPPTAPPPTAPPPTAPPPTAAPPTQPPTQAPTPAPTPGTLPRN